MVLQSYFTEDEITMLIEALNAQETKWKAVANRPIQGFGTANELTKKDKAHDRANAVTALLNKIVEYTI
jgi:hypothetical protein